MAAWRANQQLNADASRGNAGFMSLEGMRDFEAQGRQLQRAMELTGARSMRQASARADRTVNISLGGRKTNVTVASDEDADNLEGVLRSLESYAERSA